MQNYCTDLKKNQNTNICTKMNVHYSMTITENKAKNMVNIFFDIAKLKSNGDRAKIIN